MRLKTSKKRKAPSASLHVAVVIEINNPDLETGLLSSGRSRGDWASFVGVNKPEVVAAALKARSDWERGDYGPYRIMTGTLTEEIITPTNYRAVKIKRSTLRAGE